MKGCAEEAEPKISRLNYEGLYHPEWQVIAADNARMTLWNGKCEQQVIDLTSAYGAVNFGHRNPLISAFKRTTSDIAAGLYPPAAGMFAEWLCDVLELPEHRVLFQVGGSFAVSSALAIAQRCRRGKVVAIRGGFHGLGLDSLGITSLQKDSALQSSGWLAALQPEIITISPGYSEVDWSNVSAVIFEPIQGANGYIPLNSEWISGLIKDAQRSGVVVIADEIQAGFFRHGHLSPTRAQGIASDILLFSKSLTNGQSPLSAVVYHRSLERSIKVSSFLAHTYQTSAYCYAAAMAVADYLGRNPQYDAVKLLTSQLQLVASRLEQIEGVEMVYITGPTLSFGLKDARLAKRLVQTCFDKGVLCLTGGINGDRIRVAPPLTIPDEDLVLALEVIVHEVEHVLNEKSN